jgi:hypothetical protein
MYCKPRASASYIINNSIYLQPVDASTGENVLQNYTSPIIESNPDCEVPLYFLVDKHLTPLLTINSKNEIIEMFNYRIYPVYFFC